MSVKDKIEKIKLEKTDNIIDFKISIKDKIKFFEEKNNNLYKLPEKLSTVKDKIKMFENKKTYDTEIKKTVMKIDKDLTFKEKLKDWKTLEYLGKDKSEDIKSIKHEDIINYDNIVDTHDKENNIVDTHDKENNIVDTHEKEKKVKKVKKEKKIKKEKKEKKEKKIKKEKKEKKEKKK
jgi:hypothetical protein